MVVRDAVSTFQCSKTSEHPISFNETLRDICKGRVKVNVVHEKKRKQWVKCCCCCCSFCP